VNAKPLARFLYAHIPGLAVARYAAKDRIAAHFPKPEFGGVRWLSIGSGLILDVGANRGLSISAFRRLAPESNIVAFEPEPVSAKRLAIRYGRDRQVTVNSCALGTQTGAMTFYIPSYGHWNCDGRAATTRQAATEWLYDAGQMYGFNAKRLSVAEYTVQCRTLDSFGFAPLLIKLSVQGAELDILQSSVETLRRHKPALMCAFATSNISAFLSELGYRPHRYEQDCFKPGEARGSVTFTWYLTGDHARRVPMAPN